jgi:hypothetical protein
MFTRNKEVLHSLFSYKDRFVFLGYKTLQCSYRKTNVIFGDSMQGKTKKQEEDSNFCSQLCKTESVALRMGPCKTTSVHGISCIGGSQN